MYRRCRQGIGYLPQESSIFRKLTVEENLLAILETIDLNPRERQERLHSLLASSAWSTWRSSGPSRCPVESGAAWRSRVCLITAPNYILLDEPFTGIDLDRDRRDPEHRGAAQGEGHRRPDHRSQRPRDAVDHRPILHPYGGQILVSGKPAH